MPQLGFDCQIVLDGTGYFVAPSTYAMTRPKKGLTITPVRGLPPSTVTLPPLPKTPIAKGAPIPDAADGGSPVKILDRGPSQRVWKFDVLCANTLHRYDGSALGAIGQQLHDALHKSYGKVAAALDFTDPAGLTFQVAFTELIDRIEDLRTQILGVDYVCTTTLTEAV